MQVDHEVIKKVKIVLGSRYCLRLLGDARNVIRYPSKSITGIVVP